MENEISEAVKRWANETQVILQRHALERAVRNLNKIEAVALLRAAYGCNLQDAITIYNAIMARG